MILRTTVGLALCLFALRPAWAQDGAASFGKNCAKCHGTTGMSDTAVGKAMKVPHLAGDAKVKDASAADLVAAIKANKKHPPTVKSLGDADLEAAAGYARTLAAK